MKKSNLLHTLISLKGSREQSFRFAFGWKGGMKGCYTRGCEIFAPLHLNMRDLEVSDALHIEAMHNGEVMPNLGVYMYYKKLSNV